MSKTASLEVFAIALAMAARRKRRHQFRRRPKISSWPSLRVTSTRSWPGVLPRCRAKTLAS